MKLRLVLFIFVALLFVMTPLSLVSFEGVSRADEPPRAMWVWDVHIPNSSEATHELISFCKSKNINLLYISAYSFGESAKPSYRLFNAVAHKNGIKVHALAGDPRWSIERYHKQPLEWVGKVLEFNRESKKEERFDGIHSNVEPYGLGKPWEDKRGLLLKWYLDLHRSVMDLIDMEKSKVVYATDVPFWYDDDPSMTIKWHGSAKPVSHHILDTIDIIAIMDYRNFAEGPNGSIELAKSEIDYADTVGKKVYIGQETQKDLYPEYVTFGNSDEAAMEREIKKIANAYEGRKSFAGIAIHCYSSYKKLINQKK